MEESGYAGFIMPIEVYFKNKVGSWGSSKKDTQFTEEGMEPVMHVPWGVGSPGSDTRVRALAHPPRVGGRGWGHSCMWPSRGAARPHPAQLLCRCVWSLSWQGHSTTGLEARDRLRGLVTRL